MVYISDLQQLVSVWLDRMDSPTLSQSYKDALNDCIYDLNSLIKKGIDEELDYQETIGEEMYLASLEAHEKIA